MRAPAQGFGSEATGDDPLPALSDWDQEESGVYWMDHGDTQYQVSPDITVKGGWTAAAVLPGGYRFLVSAGGAMVAPEDRTSWSDDQLSYASPEAARDALSVLAWRSGASEMAPPPSAYEVTSPAPAPAPVPEEGSSKLGTALTVLVLAGIGFIFWKNW